MSEVMKTLTENIIEGIFSDTPGLVQKALDQGHSANEIIQDALSDGMDEVGRRFKNDEYFMPEVLMCAQAMKAALGILSPLLAGDTDRKPLATFVLGTVEGDLHDIGKNIVGMMLQAAGFRVLDLGVDVKAETFVETSKQENARFVGLSALLSTTMPKQGEVIQEFVSAGLRDDVKILVGGAPVTAEYAEKIGADAYGADAMATVEYCKARA